MAIVLRSLSALFRKIIIEKNHPIHTPPQYRSTPRLWGVVTKAISADKAGQVTIDDEIWRAVGKTHSKLTIR